MSTATAPNLDEAMARYQGQFIEAADLMGRDSYTLTIKDIVTPGTEKDATGKLIDKFVMTFEKAKKRLVLNKCNIRLLTAWHGTSMKGWIGKPITLEVRVLKEAFGQKDVPTIRVKLPDDVPVPFGVRKFMGRALDRKHDPVPPSAPKPAPAAAPLLDDRKPAVPETKPVSVGKSDPEMELALEAFLDAEAKETGVSVDELAPKFLIYTKNGKPTSAPGPGWFLAGTTEEDRVNRHDWLVEVYTALIQP